MQKIDLVLSVFKSEDYKTGKHLHDIIKELSKVSDLLDPRTIEDILNKLVRDNKLVIQKGTAFIQGQPYPDTRYYFLTIDGEIFKENSGYEFEHNQSIENRMLLEEQIKTAIDANNSSIATNNSINRLNLKTDEYYLNQQKVSISIAAFAAITMLVAALSFFKSCEKEPIHKVELLRSSMLQSPETLRIKKASARLHVRAENVNFF